MKKSLVGSRVLEEEKMELKYYIIEKDVEENPEKYHSFGIEIEKIFNMKIESKKVEDVTINYDKIISIANILKRNSAMPVHLVDILENIL